MRLFAGILLAGLVSAASAGGASIEQLAEMLGYTVEQLEYRDRQGNDITREEFEQLVEESPFDISKTEDKAILTITESSPEEVNKQKAEKKQVSKWVGKPFPSFKLPALGGKTYGNADLKGEYTIVNFFFATCLPCVHEVPELNAFAEENPQYQYLAITFDPEKTAREFRKERGFEWTALFNGKTLIEKIGIPVFPVFTLIGPDGRVMAIDAGSVISGDEKLVNRDNLSDWVEANRNADSTQAGL